ncbi:M23 family metallopeptidase [Pedobacter sp. MC2016-14]|uniref:M23 family metallopeptidase n=1 Tax=Pedobacter sp. MC2016-14 TaxID=2897327 RepID=UPI001E453AF5|nr:M23 family metallopeptidase [Pedobacter sp. MC2016-14]MCD0490281.1 M23 family metallopeptidase [Pedobacter sp. MC2016-14]
MRKFILFLVAGLLFVVTVKGQQIFSNNKYPLVDFRMPMDIKPPALAGSFGEIRPNHFHSGIDFRTNQREGYPVYAIADGYISRLRVQNSGFGQALYVNHANGYTSVYGHLQRFNPKIDQVVKGLQYSKKTFELDEFPQATLIPVRKGDLIAYSGNRGSSGGPHLHFEIRDTKTEATINPQLFGINIPDNIKPIIYSLYVYRLNGKPFNEFTTKAGYTLTGTAAAYRLAQGKLTLNGEYGFGIVTTDRHNGLSGTNGVYAIQLEVDGKLVFTSALERFLFENSKAVNSHIDWPAYINTKKSIQKSFVDPGNPLGIYSNLVNNGRINFTDGKLHELKYTVTDASGNASTLSFTVQAGDGVVAENKTPSTGLIFPYGKLNEYSEADFKVILPKGTLYNDLNFTHKILKPASAASGNQYSAVCQIQNNLTPLHTGFDLWIKANASLERYKDKALMVNTNGASQGGIYEDGFLKAKPKTFGSFYIAIDTIAPVIVPLNISDGKRMTGISKMSFKIRDNLSGIQSFNGYIDGEWVLMEFDTKTATLWHTFDERTTAGKHELKIVVTDMKDNSKTYTITFYK